MKTIKQIADELQVSKTAVRKKIENLGLQLSLRKNGNQFALDEEQENLIKQAFADNEVKTKNENQVCEKPQTLRLVFDTVCVLKEQLFAKDKQIEQLQQMVNQLTTALENTTQSLKASQTLHAGTMQQKMIEESKKPWWRFGKR